jgi:Carboxypeptidase regulatory-like domain
MKSFRGRTFLLALFLVFAVASVFLLAPQSFAQSTQSTGGIAGTLTDSQGASVPGASVTISNKETGFTVNLTTGPSGVFSVGNIAPGNYLVKIAAPNFKTTEVSTTVQVGQIASVNQTLELGAASATIEISTSGAQVNQEQASVQDVLTAKDIDQLPVNGRNFLDLATLEPGVQIQDGATFDPTKNGYSSLSFGGRYGRAARIMVDGVDISDETVGTVTQNVPQSAIQEFQVAQSTLDLSTEVTSSGTVNVVTKSGTNTWHGQAFYYGRSDQISARIAPEDLAFGRKQFGGDLGGAIIKDKLFFFGDVERTDQSLQSPVQLNGDFASLSGSFNSPFTERDYLGRLDYNIKPNWTMFYRFIYNQNSSVRGFNPGVYQPFDNIDHAPAHVIGTDFSFGRSTNSIRFEYLKFRNAIADAVALSGALNPIPGISVNITPNGNDLSCLSGGEAFCSGANILAPQNTFQTDHQLKYDGSYTFGKHILRYGISYNHILGGGFAKFFALQPMVQSVDNTANEAFANTDPFGPGGASNPGNWPINTILFGNGQGFSTERPQFGLPGGGQYDNRIEWYVGDQWKFRPNLTITVGVHYGHDTGRTDSDLPSISALAQFNNQFYSGLQDRVNQPDKNFSPELGLAWDPFKNGKTVFRAGAGIYYDDAIFNNVLFDRPGRLPQGLFLSEAAPCFNGAAAGPVPGVNGGNPVSYCGQAIGNAAAQVAADQVAFQAATLAAGPAANPNFIGNSLQANTVNGIQLIAPDYVSPRSVQMNFGMQRQLHPGTVLSIDYVRSVGTHTLLGTDTNKVGDARFFSQGNATAAVNTTLGFCGVGSINAAIALCPHDPLGPNDPGFASYVPRAANISDFAANGLDSGFDATGGAPCPTCAFPGINGAVGQNEMLFPIGRSTYDGLLISLKSELNHPAPGIRRMNIIASYTLSRYNAQAQDGDFVNNAVDFNNPNAFFGPNGLDRTHQVSVGAVVDLPWTTRLGLTTHWSTAAPVNLTLPQAGTPGEIFRTDITGDGTVGDIAPGTNIGAFGRSITASNINKYIAMYNANDAGQLTPAGQDLVTSGLFTQAQLTALGAVTPTLTPAPAGQVGNAPIFTFDAHLSWELRLNRVLHALPERVVLEPQVALFNVFNFHNYYPAGNQISGVLNGQPNSVNGTTIADRSSLVTPGSSSGVNWYAVPRQAEFGVKLNF